jgi:septum formation protein
MIILASTSPRRRELLSLAGFAFETAAADIDESPKPAEEAPAYVRRLAQAKAKAVQGGLSPGRAGESLIIAADTTVVLEGEILGKPADALDAVRILQRLRGRTHQVLTGLALLPTDGDRMVVELCLTDVVMRDYTDDEIWAYVHSGDPLDKAGAYAIQHNGFHPVARLEGCFANVIGLPLCILLPLLQARGVSPLLEPQLVCNAVSGQVCAVNDYMVKQS